MLTPASHKMPTICRRTDESNPSRYTLCHVFHLLLVLNLLAWPDQSVFAQNADSPKPADREPRVYNGSITPHWFANNSKFWYRREIAGGGSQFILVDAEKGILQQAFDHELVAQAFTKELKKEFQADSLPVDSIEFESDSVIHLTGEQGKWTLWLKSYELSKVDEQNSETNKNALPVIAQVFPSGSSSEESEIEFVNRLDEDVVLLWIDPSGEKREYATLKPGASHRQHTFANHVWLVAKSNGDQVAVFQAKRRPRRAIIDGRKPDAQAPSPPRSRGRGRRRQDPTTGELSPNGKWQVYCREHNLVLRELETDQETPLTTEGNSDNTWHKDVTRQRGIGMRYSMPDAPPEAVEVYWSPDSRFLIAIRTKTATLPRVNLVESSPRDQLQPKQHSYPYFKPGDQIPIQQPTLFDLESGSQMEIDNQLFANPFSISDIRWRSDSSRVTFLYNQRGHQVLRMVAVDPMTGRVSAAVNEKAATFVDYSGKSFYRFLDDTNEILWMSERDGWNHLYLYDSLSGETKNQITKGNWVVRRVDQVDEENRQIWFRAGGIHAGQDPYHVHYCRIDFDGSNLVVLTAGDGTHDIAYSPDRRYLIAKYSRVDLPPVHELRRVADGKLLCRLEEADATEFTDDGWQFPERFVAKGRDGKTDIFGIIHRPKNFDPTKSYPIIENIYAGPHSAHVPKSFRTRYRHQQRHADLGFVVVQIDGMGTSHRSKQFHDVCWKNIGDAGLPDRIEWIKAAAKKYSYLDPSRVGIYGGSAGGQNALAALLFHGGFYKVAVADCGCHDNRMDKIWWNELWMSWPVGSHYDEQSNVTNAHQLQGNLLLIVGELDRNVDPASTMQVVHALIKADKDFDLLIVPGGGHGIAESRYGSRRRADFFVEHLLRK